MMKVLFLIQGREHPASRYRALQYIPCLERNGVQSDVAVFPDGRAKWRALAGKMKQADVIFLQKKRLTPGRHRFIRRHSRARILYDVDDAVMYRSSRASTHDSAKRMKAFARTCTWADFVIAGNGYLQGLAAEHNERTAVIPTSIDTTLYPAKRFEAKQSQVILGWIGGRKSLVFLRELAPVFEELHAKHPETALKVVCNEFFDCPTMPVIKKEWAHEDEGADAASFDIGIAPLPDDVWSRGKCGTKLLQYMAAGVVPVASAVGVHREIIIDGRNGHLADTPEMWLERIERLILDREARRRMGLEARRTVERRYSLAASAPKMLHILKELAGEE